MTDSELNPLLVRQLAKSFSAGPNGKKNINLKDFIRLVNQAYTDMDVTRRRLERSITVTSQELSELYEEAQKDKEVAEIANESKSQFLANMSHEIRTPLNGVLGFANLLRTTDLNDAQKETLDVIIHSGKTLLSLLNGILDLSKVEQGNIVLEDIPFNLNDTVESCIRLLQGQAVLKKLDLNVYVDPRLPQGFVGDPERLSQVLTNLVANALKFTEKGGVGLEVNAVESPDSAGTKQAMEIRITDTGIGIPEEKIESIFDSFVQADASTTRRFGGTGLGLSISKRFVDLMGGEIFATSEVGVGTTFTVRLALPIAEGENADLLSTMDTSAISGYRALVVDDTKINRRYFHAQLNDFGMECHAVESVDAALAYLKTSVDKIDVVITDHLMPGRDGHEFIKVLRDDPQLQDLPVILSSSSGLFMEQYKNAGFNALLNKPVSQRKLLKQLKELLAGRQPKNTARTGVAASAPAPILSDIRVLVAEDNHINQRLLQMSLSEWGCVVDIVSNGQEALHSLENLHYDLILMDIRMPIMGGMEAMKLIREMSSDTADIPIIVLTANAMKGDKEAYMAQGANDYLPKPVDLISLKKKMEALVQREISEKDEGHSQLNTPKADTPSDSQDFTDILPSISSEAVA